MDQTQNGEPEGIAAVPPPKRESAVVMIRTSFQSLVDPTGDVKTLLGELGEGGALGDGTAGIVHRVPTHQLPGLFRQLAKILEDEHQFNNAAAKAAAAEAGEGSPKRRGYEGIDNWSISIQAEKPA